MLYMQPVAPWSSSFDSTAEGIVKGAIAVPVFDGPLGIERTVILDISLSWFESRFNPKAEGDCPGKVRCDEGERGKAYGLGQVHGQRVEGAEAQTIQMNRMVKQSFKACSARPMNEWLGWYAAGGNDCDRGLKESRHRIMRALWLFKKFPPPSHD